MKTLFAVAALSAALLTAPHVAMAQQGTAAPTIVVEGKFKKDWEKGSKMEAEGLRDLEDAQQDLVKYSADLVDAQNRRSSSTARAENAATDFRRLTNERASFTDARAAAKWAKQVEKAASDWVKYDDRGSDTESALDKATSRQTNARKDVEKAEKKIAKGRAMMAEAQRRSTGAKN